MMTYDFNEQAREFRRAYRQPEGVFNSRHLDLQMGLIEEEFHELERAYEEALQYIQNKKAREDCLKELADLVYVCFQFAAGAGWDLSEALHRVHLSNMSKLVDGKPVKNEAGKVMKGPNYQPPNLSDLV